MEKHKVKVGMEQFKINVSNTKPTRSFTIDTLRPLQTNTIDETKVR